MVKLLVGKRDENSGEFAGFWAEFVGEKLGSYEDNGIVHTLYRSSSYDFAAYRVHIVNETDPQRPTYELHPVREERRPTSLSTPYVRPYRDFEVAAEYPAFIKYLDYLPIHNVDPGPRA